MAIFKSFKTDFTVTPNQIINDNRISLKSVGLWTYLNSKPEAWNFSVKGTVSQKKDGRDSVSTGMRELEFYGYLKRIPKQNNDGKWDGYDYKLFDYPNTEKDDDGKSVDGEPVEHSNTILSKKELSKKEEETSLFPKEEMEPISNVILEYLNSKKPSKIPFKPTRSNLKDIEARIKEKYKMEDFIAVIDCKISEWKDSEKMKKYIRTSTLFGEKFGSYLDETTHTSSDGSDNFSFNKEEKVELL